MPDQPQSQRIRCRFPDESNDPTCPDPAQEVARWRTADGHDHQLRVCTQHCDQMAEVLDTDDGVDSWSRGPIPPAVPIVDETQLFFASRLFGGIPGRGKSGWSG